MSAPPPEQEIEWIMSALEDIDRRYDIPLSRPIKPPPPAPPIGGEPSQPHNDPMEARVAVLENRLDHIDREVSQVKWWVAGSTLTIILTMVATVVGTGVAIQQMTVATFQGAAQVAKDSAPAPQPPAAPAPIIINVPAPAAATK